MSKKISDFDREEKFDYKNIPHHFESVSQEGLTIIGNECSATLRNKFDSKMKPTTVKAMLEVIDGKFGVAYSTLEGDYDTRKANLETAYSKGLKDLYSRIEKFKRLVNEHNLAYEDYAEAMKNANGKTPNENLYYGKDRLEKIEKDYQNLRKA